MRLTHVCRHQVRQVRKRLVSARAMHVECWKRYCGQPSCTWLAYVTMKKQVAAAAPVGNKRNRTEWEQDMKVCQFCFATGKYIFAEYEPPSPRSPCFPEFDGES